MTNKKNNKTQEDKELITRLKRAEGQMKAIRKMYEEGRSCLEITQQIAAVRASLNKVAVKLLGHELQTCYQDSNSDRLKKVLDSITKIS